MSKTQLTNKEAINYIKGDWDAYQTCQKKAKAMGKYHITLRKLFYKDTGVMLPYLCWWHTQADMIKNYTK